MKRCGLTSIPPFRDLPNLEALDFSDNRLASLESLRNIRNCDNLREISLQYNKITDICGLEPLAHIPSVQILHLDNNRIRNFEVTARLPYLHTIYLAHNQIKTVSGLENLPSSRGFNFEYNQISFLSDIKTTEEVPHVRGLYFEHNLLQFLEFSALLHFPNLEELEFYKNPIGWFTGLEVLTHRTIVKGIDSLFIFKGDTYNQLRKYAQSLGWEFWGTYGDDPGTLAYGGPLLVHKISDFLEVRLYAPKRVELYVDGQPFLHCKLLLFNIDTSDAEQSHSFEQIESIDDAEQVILKREDSVSLERRSHKIESSLDAEEIFWAHASNLQAWTEHDYDTRLLHRNIAFPVLKQLAEAGDKKAKRAFKEEIARRFKGGNSAVREYLRVQGYLKHLSEDEINAIGPID
ncbi:MAG: hypothetical protein GF353_04310 [Candidatus Lokiarchaeota archaeon]|nr:hypothetical protein [Candidatus Lokiarchaeota archaeon]